MFDKLSAWLDIEATEKKGYLTALRRPMWLHARVPRQTNPYDSGTYMLHVVGVFFRDPVRYSMIAAVCLSLAWCARC